MVLMWSILIHAPLGLTTLCAGIGICICVLKELRLGRLYVPFFCSIVYMKALFLYQLDGRETNLSLTLIRIHGVYCLAGLKFQYISSIIFDKFPVLITLQ